MQQKFKALSSKPRLKLIKKLLEKNEFTCVCELESTIQRDRSVIYRHFKKLERSDLIETRKQGKRVEGKIKHPNKMKKLLKIIEEV
ncbi:hypothetical protein C9439_07895 [archaeon SCG-AAA382B04]|nr:hypothetical protein C9439_07895 [archaeon SCG-AAA382B04]